MRLEDLAIRGLGDLAIKRLRIGDDGVGDVAGFFVCLLNYMYHQVGGVEEMS